MRDCDNCNYCCSGHLAGEVNYNKFGNMIPCAYLADKCTIYSDRPKMCSDYYCAWAQELFPEWMQPNKCGVIISVEKDLYNRQFLKAVSVHELPIDVKNELETFVNKNNTYYVFLKIIPISIQK